MDKLAYIFPGQGSQFTGMGKNLYDNIEAAKPLFLQANEIVGFDITQTMFTGTAEDLKSTNVTQPAIFIHSVIAYLTLSNAKPAMVAGHSLGEISALVANQVLRFEDALRLVCVRANAMQKACLKAPSTMAAVLNIADEILIKICATITQEEGEIVVPANFNCPGQIVISGSIKGIEIAEIKLKEAGAKRVLKLPVGGAFHSPFMQPAQEELAQAIYETKFNEPICPIFQNVTATGVSNAAEIKENLIKQLTGSVRWTETIQNMITAGATQFIEVGPGKVLQGLVQKINKDVVVTGVQ